MKKLIVIVAVLSFGVSFAQQREDMNLRGERKRVTQGVKSGEINKAEATILTNQASQVRRAERKAKSDGVITARERAKIAHKDAKLDRTIYKTKHN